MNKKYLIIISIGIFLVAIVSAGILSDGILTKQEIASLSNSQIANYMKGNLNFVKYTEVEDNNFYYWNITYLEPTTWFNNETNQTEKAYREFTQAKPFKVSKSLYETCLTLTSNANCKGILITNENVYNWTRIENNETISTIIKSTYLMAYEEQTRQYERAKKIRDNANNNILKDLN